MGLRKNNKGIFFTAASIVLSAIIILSLQSFKETDIKQEADVIGTRIVTMNNFIKDVEHDLENGLQIASFRAIASMIEHISTNGTYVDNVELRFVELMTNGTLYGNQLNLMVDSTFVDWADSIQFQADLIDVQVNFSILTVDINQTDPWTVFIETSINMTIADKKGTSFWNRIQFVNADVKVTNFEDPLYLVNSNGRVTNPIVESPFEFFVVGQNVDNLIDHFNESYYVTSAVAPSFLMRLQGDLGNSSNGIESLVDAEEFEDQGFAILDRSVVDYIYFGNQSTTNQMVNNTPSWFQIDNDHLDFYGVTNITI